MSFAVFAAPAEQEFDITKFGTNLVSLSLTGFSGDVQSTLTYDLEIAGFRIASPDAAQYNVIGNNNGAVEGRVTDRITKAAVLPNRRYANAPLRAQAHAFADDIVLKLTGQRGIAQTRIAFRVEKGGQSEVYVADYDGWNPAAATQDGSVVATPSWVPGRRMIFYTSYKSVYPQVFSQDLASGERRPITHFAGLNVSPAISPDGRHVAMILSKGGSPDLWVASLDGSNLTQLTHSRPSEAASSPCWSPDSQTICFAWGPATSPSLHLISASGGVKRPLRTGGGRTSEPDWSPDGKWIAFTAMRGSPSVCIVAASGGTAIDLFEGEDPSWAPNSRTILFTRVTRNKRSLSLLDVPTKRVKDVHQSSGSWSQPSWAK